MTNNSTRPRAQLAEELRDLGFELEDDELQTTPRAAARELAGKRVFALVMAGVVPDLEGIELVGDHADAVLIGGCDETIEPNQVFCYMNLARAFAEIQMGAELYCLHKNKWWQTSRGPLLDAGAFVAGLEYATGVEATVLGKPSPAYFAAALDALGAEPELTWLVSDDVDADVRGGAARSGCGPRSSAPASSGPRRSRARASSRTIVLSSVAAAARLARAVALTVTRPGRHRPDRDRADRARARATRLPRPLLHDGRAGVLRVAAATRPRATRRASAARRRSARRSAAASCFTWKEIEIVGPPKPGVTLTGKTLALGGAGRACARSTSR